MPRLRLCSHCGSHVRSTESTCPFCASATPSVGVGAVAVVFAGLALVGCEKKGSGPMPPPEPDYGVAITDSDGGAPPPGDDAGMPPDDGGAPVEPDYGVPVAEPEYGVADPG